MDTEAFDATIMILPYRRAVRRIMLMYSLLIPEGTCDLIVSYCFQLNLNLAQLHAPATGMRAWTRRWRAAMRHGAHDGKVWDGNSDLYFLKCFRQVKIRRCVPQLYPR